MFFTEVQTYFNVIFNFKILVLTTMSSLYRLLSVQYNILKSETK